MFDATSEPLALRVPLTLRTLDIVEEPVTANEVVVAFVNKVAPLSVVEAKRFANVEFSCPPIVEEAVTESAEVVPAPE